MATLKHLVIFIYIAELLAFAMLFMGRRRSGSKLIDTPVALLCAFMVLRIAVKMLYFYVEFYVLPWHLSILYNALMDTTYVISITLCLWVVRECTGAEIPHKRLYAFACILYVVCFALVELIWVDRASNHLIVFAGTIPKVIYTANELIYLSVATYSIVSQTRSASGSDHAAFAKAMGVTLVLYVIYVFLWDTSFTIPGLDVIRLIKPFDGVLVFGAALAIIIVRFCPQTGAEGSLAVSGRETNEASVSSASDLAAFAAEFGLTAREAEVLELLFQGKSSSQVAEELVISVNTAKRHAYNIYRKVGVGSRYELIYRITHPNEAIPPSISEKAGE